MVRWRRCGRTFLLPRVLPAPTEEAVSAADLRAAVPEAGAEVRGKNPVAETSKIIYSLTAVFARLFFFKDSDKFAV